LYHPWKTDEEYKGNETHERTERKAETCKSRRGTRNRVQMKETGREEKRHSAVPGFNAVWTGRKVLGRRESCRKRDKG
jgi:hypothetical protein